MSKISHQEVAVLGLLYEHHHYAYRIQEIMEKRGMESWANVNYFQIQNKLDNLLKEGLVVSEIRRIDVGNEDVKEVYSITDNGSTVLINEIKSMLSKKEVIFYPFNLAISNITVLNDKEINESLKSYLKSLEGQINYLESSMKIQKENKIPFNFISITKRSLFLLKAERQWVKEFIQEV